MECRRNDPDSTATENWNSAIAVGLPASQPTTSLQLSAESLLPYLQFLYYKCLRLVQYNASALNMKWLQYAEQKPKKSVNESELVHRSIAHQDFGFLR